MERAATGIEKRGSGRASHEEEEIEPEARKEVERARALSRSLSR